MEDNSVVNQGAPNPATPQDQFEDEIKKVEVKIEWDYYSENNDFLLRYGLMDQQIIRIEVLITNTISEMYARFYKTEDLIKDSGYDGENMDAFTILKMIFKEISIEGKKINENDEFVLKIKIKNILSFTLKKCVCNDKIFINKNIKKKIEQFKKRINEKYKEFENENKKLKEKNKILKDELENIKKINKDLSDKNEIVSRELKKTKEIQIEATKQLTELFKD